MSFLLFIDEEASPWLKDFKEKYRKMLEDLARVEGIPPPELDVVPFTWLTGWYYPRGVMTTYAVVIVWGKVPEIGKPLADWIVAHEFGHHLVETKKLFLPQWKEEAFASDFAFRKTKITRRRFAELQGEAEKVITENYLKWREQWRK